MAAPSHSILDREAVEGCLPKLLMASNKTDSSALHDITYIGALKKWTGFRQDVQDRMLDFPPDKTVIDYHHQSRDLREEEVYVADETGVQGRFQQSVGQILGTVLGSQEVNIRFGDSKSAGTKYQKIPDVAIVSRDTPAIYKAVGELKTPWVEAHKLTRRYGKEKALRAVIGQVVEYMIDEKVRFGFHSTYQETIFLRCIQAGSEWRIEYSPIFDRASVRRCFWHFSLLAAEARPLRAHPPKRFLIRSGEKSKPKQEEKTKR